MPEQVNVFYEGWGERWQWGTLISTTALTGRPLIAFEYSDEARQRGLELSAYTLPLKGARLRQGFPEHQMHLPGPEQPCSIRRLMRTGLSGYHRSVCPPIASPAASSSISLSLQSMQRAAIKV